MSDDALGQYLRGIEEAELAPPLSRKHSSLALVRQKSWARCRICPLCSQSNQPSPIYFDFPLSLRCEEHQVYLIDCCSTCGTDISYLRKYPLHCNCGQSLSNLPAQKTDSTIDLFFGVFAPWRANANWQSHSEAYLEDEVNVARVLRELLCFASEAYELNVRYKPWLSLQDWPIISALLSPWPDELSNIVASATYAEQVRPVTSLLRKLEQSEIPIFLALKERIENLLLKQRGAVCIDGISMVPLQRVRDIAKLDAAATTAFFQSNYFHHKSTTKGPKGPLYWISLHEFEALEKWLRETVDITRAAEIIGSTQQVVKGLTRTKHLEGLYLPPKPRSPRFLRSTVDQFIYRVESRICLDIPDPGPCVALAEILPISANCKVWYSSWVDLLNKIFAGAVPLFRINHQRGWKGLGVRETDVIDCKIHRA